MGRFWRAILGQFSRALKATTPFLSVRRSFETMDDAASMVRIVAAEGVRQIPRARRNRLIVVARNDDDVETLDLEIGFALTRSIDQRVSISGSDDLRMSELPGVATMATIVRQGTNPASHLSFATIGVWLEAHEYEIAGPCREVFLEPVVEPPGFERALVEIQFPVRKAGAGAIVPPEPTGAA